MLGLETKRKAYNTYIKVLVGSGMTGFALFMTLLVCLLLYSSVTHGYILLSLAVSQVALRLAQISPKQETNHARS